MMTVSVEKVKGLNKTHIIQLEGQPAKLISPNTMMEYGVVEAISGKQMRYSWPYIIDSLKGKKGFNFGISNSLTGKNNHTRKQLPMVITDVKEKVKDISAYKMLELIKYEDITVDGQPCKLAVHFNSNKPIPRFMNKVSKENYYSDWGTVIDVIEVRGAKQHGHFVKEDMIDLQESVARGTTLAPRKPEITKEEIEALCKAEVTIEGLPAAITYVNETEGCISALESGGPLVNRHWDHIQFTVINREGMFFLNPVAHEKRQTTNSSASSSTHVNLYQDFSEAISSHKNAKEKLGKLIGITLEKKQSAVADLQVLYFEMNKLELLLELAKDKHGWNNQSQVGPHGWGGAWGEGGYCEYE